MLKLNSLHITPGNLAFFFSLVLVIALTTSKALLSISTGGIAVAAIWYYWQTRKEGLNRGLIRMALLTSLLFFLPLISYFWSSDLPEYRQDLQSKLSFLVLPLAYSVLPRFSPKQYIAIFGVFCLTLTVIALLSVGMYLMDFENMTSLVAKNSSIQILGGVNHIYFGYILAFSVLLGFHLFLQKSRVYSPKEPYVFLAMAIAGVISLHVLTSRTGIIAFYGGAAAYLFLFVIKEKAYLKGGIMLLLLFLIPTLSYLLIPSFKYRYEVTIWDAQEYDTEGKSLNHHTVGLRFVTWQTAWDIFLEHPVLGVGMGDVKSELVRRYEEQNLNARRKLWLTSCHNQYLEQLAGLGIVGLGLLLWVMLMPLAASRWKPGLLLFCFLGLTAVAMIPESILERQIGIAFFSAFLFLILRWEEASN